jgi:hypothetical protein
MTDQIVELTLDDCDAVSGGSGYLNASGRTEADRGGGIVTSGG